MTSINITQVTNTGTYSDADHFSSNFLPAANTGETPFGGNEGNPYGNPTNESAEVLEQFGVGSIRLPAGQNKEFFSDYGIYINDDISPELRNLLTYAQTNDLAVSLVVPVASLEAFGGAGIPELYDQLQQMAEVIERDFPGVVQYYELGNEYWQGREIGDGSPEAIYGAQAAQAALALDAGMSVHDGQSNIILQTAGNLGGAHDSSLTQANLVIQDAFDDFAGAVDTLDGVLRNFYWRDRHDGEFHNSTGMFQEDRALYENLHGADGNLWEGWADQDLLEMVGEYNIANNLGTGTLPLSFATHGASIMLEHYSNLVSADVDVAFIWPILHNTRNALVHVHEDIVTTEIHGMEVVVNSTRAAMIDVLRQTVAGYELVDVIWSGGGEVEITAFEGRPDQAGAAPTLEKVVFLSSRVDSENIVDLDLSLYIGDYINVTGLSISAGGEHHHHDATITDVSIDDPDGDGRFQIALDPYEVVQLVFTTDPVTYFDEGAVSGAGDDSIDGTGGEDSISTHGGDDWVWSENGNDTINTGTGNDTIHAGSGEDVIYGGSGEDVIYGHSSADLIHGDDGNDLLDGGWGFDVVHGGAGADTIIGAGGDDRLHGDANNDNIRGGDGDDSIAGGSHEDMIRGDDGHDLLRGDGGFDTIYGGMGDDIIDGGHQADRLFGDDGNDTVRGDNGVDRAYGGNGDDLVQGGAGNDTLFGQDGDDVINGGDNDDRAMGGRGDDHLTGDAGNDTLIGEAGFDTLVGGTGDDVLTGRFNGDTFVFEDGHGHDTITDFDANNNVEKIDLRGVTGATSFDDLASSGTAIVQNGADVLLVTGDDSSVLLLNTNAADLDALDFVF